MPRRLKPPRPARRSLALPDWAPEPVRRRRRSSAGKRRRSADETVRVCRFLWACSILFVIYGLTIPFRFVGSADIIREHVAGAIQSASAGPAGISRTDVVQNILLFLPIGFFGAGSFH